MIVVWRVTERCNLACSFCAYDRRVVRSRRDADATAIADFGPVLAAYRRVSGDSVLVSWLGGEPLLWPPLAELTRTFVREYGLRVSATTNGTGLASAALRAHIIEHYTELTVSVDGFAPLHDTLRGWRDGFATLKRSVQALVREKGAGGPLLRANIVLMRDNVADLEPLCLELASWGIDEITFNQLGGADRPEFYPAHRLRPNDIRHLTDRLDALRESLAAAGTTLRGSDRYVERIASTVAGRRMPVLDCGPGELFMFVSERGLVAPCSFTVDEYGVPVTELTAVRDVIELPMRFAAARASRLASVCGDCPSTQVFAKFDAADAKFPQS
jgi:MoaA/NifB/PqqE/SkfB family radical SAM enzyme